MPATLLLDGSPMGGGITGAGRYAYKLIDNLIPIAEQYRLRIVVPPETRNPWDVSHWREARNVEIIEASISGAGVTRQWFYLTHRFEYDLFHSLSSYLPLGIQGRSVVTIHDLKYVLGDWQANEFSPLKRLYVHAMMWNSVLRADSVITVSEHTKSDLINTFSIEEGAVKSVPLGPGEVKHAITMDSPIDAPYLLFVGELRPHKNVSALVEAYNRLREGRRSEIHLAIVGQPYDDHDPLEALDPRFRSDVHLLGGVSDETLATLYRDAEAFVFPSLYEGFGLPVLEAMGYETPVIVSDRTSVPEVAGDAGLYFDPEDIDELRDKLKQVTRSDAKRAELSERARERFSEFSWERTATQTLDVYECVLKS